MVLLLCPGATSLPVIGRHPTDSSNPKFEPSRAHCLHSTLIQPSNHYSTLDLLSPICLSGGTALVKVPYRHYDPHARVF